MEQEAAGLEEKTQQPDFWSDSSAAQDAMRRLSQLNTSIDTWRDVERRPREASELLDLAETEGDAEMVAHVDEEAEAIDRATEAKERELAFSGPYDARNAILAIHAGAGGTESQDWAEMLMRM